MTPKLTDDQVAALADEPAFHDGNGWRVLPDFVQALALEVQSSRTRIQELEIDLQTERERYEEWRVMAQEQMDSSGEAMVKAASRIQELEALVARGRPAFVCDATCLNCEEGEPCPTRHFLAELDAALGGVK